MFLFQLSFVSNVEGCQSPLRFKNAFRLVSLLVDVCHCTKCSGVNYKAVFRIPTLNKENTTVRIFN